MLAIYCLKMVGVFEISIKVLVNVLNFGLVIQMGVAAVVHLYVFPAEPYKRGERCVRNVAVMADYASLGSPPDPEEVRDGQRFTKGRFSPHSEERRQRPRLHQSVRDVVVGSGEIVRSTSLHFYSLLSNKILFICMLSNFVCCVLAVTLLLE